MPNYTNNWISFRKKEDFDTIVRECFTDGSLDFNKIVPMPEVVHNTISGSKQWEIRDFTNGYTMQGDPEKIMDLFEKSRGSLEPGDRYFLMNTIICAREYGTPTWYEWCIDNWGTKWDAMETTIDENMKTIYFVTAWAPPLGIYKGLAKKYPALSCKAFAEDEDLSDISGRYDIYIENGKIEVEEYGLNRERTVKD